MARVTKKTREALRERYRRDEVDLCPYCGKTLKEGVSAWSDGSVPLYCRDHPGHVTRLLRVGDADVLAVLDALEKAEETLGRANDLSCGFLAWKYPEEALRQVWEVVHPSVEEKYSER